MRKKVAVRDKILFEIKTAARFDHLSGDFSVAHLADQVGPMIGHCTLPCDVPSAKTLVVRNLVTGLLLPKRVKASAARGRNDRLQDQARNVTRVSGRMTIHAAP